MLLLQLAVVGELVAVVRISICLFLVLSRPVQLSVMLMPLVEHFQVLFRLNRLVEEEVMVVWLFLGVQASLQASMSMPTSVLVAQEQMAATAGTS